MFRALRPDVDVSQTMAYLAQTTQTSTSTVAPATKTMPAQPMPFAIGELAGDGGRAPNEGTKEVVEEEEPPQGSIEVGDEVWEILEEGKKGAMKGEACGIAEVPEGEAAQAEKEEKTAEGVSNPEQSNPEGEGINPLQMNDFHGQPASSLPDLAPQTEISPPEEDVLLLEGPSHPDELSIIDLSCDSGVGKEDQRREKKRKGKLLA